MRPVVEALRARAAPVQAVFVAAGRRLDPALRDALQRGDVEPVDCAPALLDALTGGAHHQGVLAVLGDYPYRNLAGLLSEAPRDRPLLLLDEIQDPHNLGAILRSAYVLGAAGAVIPTRRACGITSAVVRTSAGATEHLPVARVTNLGRAMAALKEVGYWLYGAHAAAGPSAGQTAGQGGAPDARPAVGPGVGRNAGETTGQDAGPGRDVGSAAAQPAEHGVAPAAEHGVAPAAERGVAPAAEHGVAPAAEHGVAYDQLDLSGPTALVLGSEGAGLRRSVRQACDALVCIPMDAPLSLNVSVAAGILLAEAARQRRRSR